MASPLRKPRILPCLKPDHNGRHSPRLLKTIPLGCTIARAFLRCFFSMSLARLNFPIFKVNRRFITYPNDETAMWRLSNAKRSLVHRDKNA
ncbi:hypothetical protein KC352_g16 [Hortaea werneckii]|nr:hypothetical protein KC352_g16 [Hortaea werneckii]